MNKKSILFLSLFFVELLKIAYMTFRLFTLLSVQLDPELFFLAFFMASFQGIIPVCFFILSFFDKKTSGLLNAVILGKFLTLFPLLLIVILSYLGYIANGLPFLIILLFDLLFLAILISYRVARRRAI